MEKPQPLTGKELVVDCAEDTLNKRYKMYSKGWQNKKNLDQIATTSLI